MSVPCGAFSEMNPKTLPELPIHLRTANCQKKTKKVAKEALYAILTYESFLKALGGLKVPGRPVGKNPPFVVQTSAHGAEL